MLATYNTDNSAHSLSVVGVGLLDEASREEEGKEAQDAEAQGPASRSVLHYWKLWRSVIAVAVIKELGMGIVVASKKQKSSGSLGHFKLFGCLQKEREIGDGWREVVGYLKASGTGKLAALKVWCPLSSKGQLVKLLQKIERI